jgi:hypothetical protein
MWDKFIQEKVVNPSADEVAFFDQSITAKRNRSKFAKKVPTPFLSSTQWVIRGSFSPPLPSTQGIPNGRNHVYQRFPDMDLSEETIGTVRTAQPLVSR